MTDRSGRWTDTALEADLTDLGAAVAWPQTPDLAGVVVARLRGTDAPASAVGRLPVRRGRPIRRAVLLAAVLVLAVAGAAAAVRLGLDLLDIDIGPIPSPAASPAASPSAPASAATSAGPTTPAPTPAVPGLRLGLGRSTTLADAHATAAFPVRVPADLGEPDRVYVGGPGLRGQVAFLYDPRRGLPASDLLDGAAVLVTQNHGEADDGLAHKLVGAGLATIESVSVDGASGYWISGQPHMFWYLAPDGTAIQESRRLVGDTLVWERDGVLYRIEGAMGRDRALEIAASMS